jgi:NADH-quinone oxidoreductase subunit I
MDGGDSMYGKGLLEGMAVTLKNFFKKNVTEMYPEEKPRLSERFHGSFILTADKCIACGICSNACPNMVIKIGSERDENKKRFLTSFEMDIQYCLFCGLCVESCPTDAINFNKEFELACYSRQGVVLNMWQRPENINSSNEG